MKIEAGKKYRTVDGRCVELRKSNNSAWPFTSDAWRHDFWSGGEGRAAHAFAGQSYSHKYGGKGDGANLIAEWTDGPVREVTRKEIVPGTYGRLKVNPSDQGDYGDYGVVEVQLVNRHGNLHSSGDVDPALMTVAELRAAASTLTAIADALEETK